MPGSPQAPEYVALSHDVSSLLLDIAIGVHHFAMYPPDHPSLQPTVHAIIGRLGNIFVDRRTLTVGVAQRQLVVEGAATDPKHPALSELAHRLHKHQLGALVFNRGVKSIEIREVLTTLAPEVDTGATPIGLLDPDEFPFWENARLFRIGYEDLELSEGGHDGRGMMDRATALWLGLAQAAMPNQKLPPEGPEGHTLASYVMEQGGDRKDESIAAYVRHLAYELRGARGHDAVQVQRRLSEFLGNLDEEALGRIVEFGGSVSERKRFVLDANQSLSVDAVFKVLGAAATRSGQGISTSMTRLLSKLAIHAERGDGEAKSMADTAVRDNVEALLDGWDLKDPNPDTYTLELDAMARAAPVFDVPDSDDPLTGAVRLIQMAIEVDADGEIINRAVPDLIKEQGVGPLLDLLKEAPAENRVAERIKSEVATSDQLRQLLFDERVDPRSLRVLVDWIGPTAVAPLLDVMEDSESRSVRRMIFDAMAELRLITAEEALKRLHDAPWFVVRNILALLNGLEDLPEELNSGQYLEHADIRVRRVALPLVLRSPEQREAALAAALGEEDAHMVRVALIDMLEGVPGGLLPTLAEEVVKAEDQSEELRALGAKVLATTGEAIAHDTLYDVAVVGKTLLRRPRLAPKSSVVLASLRALANGWPNEKAVRAVVRQGRRSKDADIRAAVEVVQTEGPR